MIFADAFKLLFYSAFLLCIDIETTEMRSSDLKWAHHTLQ